MRDWIVGSVLLFCAGIGVLPDKSARPACKCEPCACRKETVFVGAVKVYGGFVAVTDETQCQLDGKPAEWEDIPDETTELVEITINKRRNVAVRMIYMSVVRTD